MVNDRSGANRYLLFLTSPLNRVLKLILTLYLLLQPLSKVT